MAQLETPDWAQNDETAKDFIKNRPFYSAVGEGVIDTGARGIAAASEYGRKPIPKARINNVVYTNVESIGYDGMYCVFPFPPYTVKVNFMHFYVDISGGDIPITTNDIEILGETIIDYPIPPQYLPEGLLFKDDAVQSDWAQSDTSALDYIKNKPAVISDHNVKFVTPLAVNSGVADINTRSFVIGTDVAILQASTLEDRISFKKVSTTAGTMQIYSCKTGKPITDDKLPYGFMVITRIRFLADGKTRAVYCLNPA